MSQIILLVEDNEDDVFAFTRALRKADVHNPVHIATDGKQAMEFLQGADATSLPILPFIIFLDLKLPYVSGFEILKWIRQQRSFDNVLVVILTSSAEVKDKQQAYSLGARTYLVKPPSDEDIRQVIISLQSFWTSKGLPSPLSKGVADY